MGRSVIRNILTEQAQGEFFLFLDCDVLPDSEHFMRDYLEYVQRNDRDVVCGGDKLHVPHPARNGIMTTAYISEIRKK